MSWQRPDQPRSVSWQIDDHKNGLINCEGGGAEVNNCRVNVFNISINLSKDFNPDALKALVEILDTAKQQLPSVKTQHEVEAEHDAYREKRRLEYKKGLKRSLFHRK